MFSRVASQTWCRPSCSRNAPNLANIQQRVRVPPAAGQVERQPKMPLARPDPQPLQPRRPLSGMTSGSPNGPPRSPTPPPSLYGITHHTPPHHPPCPHIHPSPLSLVPDPPSLSLPLVPTPHLMQYERACHVASLRHGPRRSWRQR